MQYACLCLQQSPVFRGCNVVRAPKKWADMKWDFLEMWMKQALFGNPAWLEMLRWITPEYSEPPTSYVVKPLGLNNSPMTSETLRLLKHYSFVSVRWLGARWYRSLYRYM